MKLTNYQNMDKTIGVVTLVIILFVVINFALRETPDTRTVETDINFTTQELFLHLESKTEEDLSSYVEKAIEIEGVIKEITYRNGVYSLILNGVDQQHYILCEMQRDQVDQILQLSVGDKIVVKGILKGFLMDAILLNCIIV